MSNADASKDTKVQYGMWLGLPPDVREPKTHKELAVKLGVTPQYLNRIERTDPLVQDSKRNALKLFGGFRKFNIIQALMDKAEGGSYQHQKLYLEWQGDIGPKKDADRPTEIKVTIAARKQIEETKKVIAEMGDAMTEPEIVSIETNNPKAEGGIKAIEAKYQISERNDPKPEPQTGSTPIPA